MTHAPQTSTMNRLHFSGADFWYMCRANLGLDTSGTRFRRRLEHRSISSQKVACTVHVTEMVTCDWSMIIVDVFNVLWSCCMCSAVICSFIKYFQQSLCLAPEILNVPDTNRRLKLESIYGASFSSVCHGPYELNRHQKSHIMVYALSRTSAGWLQYNSLTSHSIHKSLRRPSSQPISWLVQNHDWIGLRSVLRPRQHSIGYMGDSFYRSKDPTNSIKVLKENLQKTNQTTQRT